MVDIYMEKQLNHITIKLLELNSFKTGEPSPVFFVMTPNVYSRNSYLLEIQ